MSWFLDKSMILTPKSLNTKRLAMTYGGGSIRPVLRQTHTCGAVKRQTHTCGAVKRQTHTCGAVKQQTHTCGAVKQVNGISTLTLLIIQSSTAIYKTAIHIGNKMFNKNLHRFASTQKNQHYYKNE